MPAARCIMHLDMDAFFAAIEQLDRPELRGKPVLVGSDRARGVVTTASYEARPFGCRSAQPMVVAKRLCPHAVIVPVRGTRYREISRQVFAILHESAPVVEPVSIDEAFLDVTGTQRLLGEPADLARRIKQRIADELRLTASIGVAPNKFLAKLASDAHKPDGLTVIGPREIEQWLPTLPVERIPGVGPRTMAKMHRLRIRTIGDLRARSAAELRRDFGADGPWYARLALGQDDRPVTPDSPPRSISHERTFEYDLEDSAAVRRVLLEDTERVARRLRIAGLTARSVSLKIRFGDFQTISRSATLDEPTDTTDELWRAARALFDTWVRKDFHPVRLIGVQLGQLGPQGASSLFIDQEALRRRRVDAAADAIVRRFGPAAVRRGETLGS